MHAYRKAHAILKLPLIYILILWCSHAYADITQLSVSANKRYLKDTKGTPVYLIGDTAWTLPENGIREDVDFFLGDRKKKGFNFVLVVAVRDLDSEPLNPNIASRTMNPKNRYGHLPFRWRRDKADISRPIVIDKGTPDHPNDYWDHLEYILKRATQLNLYVGLVPVWGKYYINNANARLRIFTTGNAKSYGYFLGKRYRSYPNLIWILGGDIGADRFIDGRPIYRAMAEGLVKGVTGHSPAWHQEHPAWSQLLITYHCVGSAADFFNDDKWLHLNMTYEVNQKVLTLIRRSYANHPTRPILEGESYYEGYVYSGFNITTQILRRQLHYTFLAGGIGYAYGVAKSTATNHDQVFRFQGRAWRDRLNLPGVSDILHIKKILDISEWWLWAPAQYALTDGTQNVAIRSSKGDQIVVYFPNMNKEIINLSLIATHPRVKAVWHDPRSGTQRDHGVFMAKANVGFLPPASWEDAVLNLTGIDGK